MKIFRKKLNQSVGRAPGEFTYYGEEERKETTIRVIQYNNDEFDERILSHEDQIKDIHENSKVTWIDIEGFSNLEMISSIFVHASGCHFGGSYRNAYVHCWIFRKPGFT